jgi:hypothetical protein
VMVRRLGSVSNVVDEFHRLHEVVELADAFHCVPVSVPSR